MIEELIKKSFPSGLPYNSAVQLCQRLFCSTEGIPSEHHKECSKENLPEIFAKLSVDGFINTVEHEAVLYGANFHDINDKGHWVEVIASIFKFREIVDEGLGEQLVSHLTNYAADSGNFG